MYRTNNNNMHKTRRINNTDNNICIRYSGYCSGRKELQQTLEYMDLVLNKYLMERKSKNNERSTEEIKNRIRQAKVAFNSKKSLLTSQNVNLTTRKRFN